VKRFYRAATVAAEEGAFHLALDGRPARTPAKRVLAVPARAAAEALAAEWAAQPEEFEPAALRLTRLANTAIDRVAVARAETIAEVARYAATDLVCYRAAEPAELALRQAEAWQPLVDWAQERFGAALAVTAGVVPMPQPEAALAALARAVAAYDDFALTALHAATAAAGSLVIGLALAEGRIDAEEAFADCCLDELYQAEQWGRDFEAEERRDALRADIAAASRFMALLRR
jgi:chaperone required for assembly of F1-ATPase